MVLLVKCLYCANDSWCVVEILELSLVKILRLKLGGDFKLEIWLRSWGWSLVKIWSWTDFKILLVDTCGFGTTGSKGCLSPKILTRSCETESKFPMHVSDTSLAIFCFLYYQDRFELHILKTCCCGGEGSTNPYKEGHSHSRRGKLLQILSFQQTKGWKYEMR